MNAANKRVYGKASRFLESRHLSVEAFKSTFGWFLKDQSRVEEHKDAFYELIDNYWLKAKRPRKKMSRERLHKRMEMLHEVRTHWLNLLLEDGIKNDEVLW